MNADVYLQPDLQKYYRYVSPYRDCHMIFFVLFFACMDSFRPECEPLLVLKF
jgi:hypothetical protein